MSSSVKGMEVTVSLDSVPNLIRLGRKEEAEAFLEQQFRKRLGQSIDRWGQLPSQVVQLKYFEPLSRQARSLYIDGYFAATIALCGMAVHALCISVAVDRVKDGNLRSRLLDPEVWERTKIDELKKYFRIDTTSSLLHQVLGIRNDYLHLHKDANSENALDCISRLYLATLSEYGLLFDGQGSVRCSTRADIEAEAKRLGIPL